MIFSELYSVYYNTVAGILATALEEDVTEEKLQEQVYEKAFSESVLTIIPWLKSEKWQLLHEDFTPVVYNKPTMPLTFLQKRWLKSIVDDPRIRLFGVEFPELGDVEPLFTKEDYKIYDQYLDGDFYEDEKYIYNFQIIKTAIKENSPVKVMMENKKGKYMRLCFYPTGFEYSIKDDKIRVLAKGCKYKYFNMGRICTCEFCDEDIKWEGQTKEEKKKYLVIHITDERNALERVMLHFAHFEKQAERIDESHYVLKLWYYENDETELVIRILSFGPFIKVIEPESFIKLIKNRLVLQKGCELK